MKYLDKIDLNYYQSIVKNNLRMHNSFLLYSGSFFQSSSSLTMSKLSKTVCGLANSGGGEIIFGIETKNFRAINFSPIINFNKDDLYLYHEIQSQIEPPIKDLQIKLIDFTANCNDKLLHIVVPYSNGQPHMFSDNRYYKLNKTRISVLNEQDVRSLYNINSISDLEFLGLYNTNGLPNLLNGKFTSINFYPKFLIRNSGNKVEKDYKIELSFPSSLYEESFQPLKYMFIRHDGSYVVFGQKGVNSLFQDETSTIIEAKITVNISNIQSFLDEYIKINLYFTSGVKKHVIKLSESLTYNGKHLNINDFTQEI